jgi:hypothetical protein
MKTGSSSMTRLNNLNRGNSSSQSRATGTINAVKKTSISPLMNTRVAPKT